MNISDIFNQVSQQMNQQLIKAANGGKTVETPQTVTAKAMEGLLGMKEGEVFEGTVTKMDAGKVLISLANGSSLSARVEEGVSLQKGVATFFQVKSNVEGQIALKAVTQDMFSNPTLVKALTTASLPVTQRNLDMVQSMMSKQMPIDAKSLGTMARVAFSFPNASVDTLTQLEKLKLPINEQNIEQLEHYRQGEGKVQTRLEQVMKALPALVNEAGDAKAALQMNERLLAVFTENEAEGKTQMQSTEGKEDFTVEKQAEQPVMRERAAVENGTTEEPVLREQPEVSAKTTQAQMADKADAGTPSEVEVAPKPAQDVEAAPKPATTTNVAQEAEMPEKPAASLTKEASLEGKENVEKPIEYLKTLEKSEGTNLEKLRNLTQFLKEHTVEPKEIKQLFSSDTYRNLLERVSEEQWFMKPEEMEDKEKLKQLYQRMDRQLAKLEAVLSEAGKGDSTMARQITDTRGNLSFMNDVHQLYNYVQIPLKMANQNATGDLYIYTNKKALRNKSDDISAHLHLDMEHLGPTDVFVRLRGKNLSTNFMLADEKSLDLVMGHIDILTKRLNDKGYDVDMTVKDNEQQMTQKEFVEELLGQEVAPKEAVSRYSFDVKV
ncbi:hook-length control protein FliK [Lachnospiraceae bacterium XBB1006]|nr:hook-length control protein FliK [Lachnospiraceae bacterium XBB1006]